MDEGKSTKLTPKQERFCEEYLIDFNASQAAIRAGYSKRSARQIADTMLTKHDIQKYLSELQQQVSDRNGVTVDMLMQEWKAIGFANPKNYFEKGYKLKDITDIPDNVVIAISEVTTTEIQIDEKTVKITKKLKLHDKVAALINMGKRIGFYDKHNTQKQQKIIVQHVNGDDDDLLSGTLIIEKDEDES